MKFAPGVFLAAALASFAMSSQAAVVKVWGESFDLSTINNFYNGLPGNSSSIATGQLNTVDLTGVGLLWAVQPADAYTPAELTTMGGFLAAGGRIAFMGEHGTFKPNENLRINAALTFLGSTIQIVNTLVDPLSRTASVGDGQIKANPLTVGVNTYQYAAFAPLTVSGTAQTLMVGEESANDVMMAYQNIGPGSVFLITDQNVWDNAPTWGGTFNNARMFENLLVAVTGAPPPPAIDPPPPGNNVPTPGSLALVGIGLALLGASRRRAS